MKKYLIFFLVAVTAGIFSCKKENLEPPVNNNTTNPIDSNTVDTTGIDTNQVDTVVITQILQKQIKDDLEQIIENLDSINVFDICSGGARSTTNSSSWNVVYPSLYYDFTANQEHTVVGVPIKGTEYKHNVHVVNGQLAVAYGWKNFQTGESHIEGNWIGSATGTTTLSSIFTKYDIPLGAEKVFALKAISDTRFYYATYDRSFAAQHRVDMSEYKHVYQNYLPVHYNDDSKFMNENQAQYYPFYQGTYQFGNYSANLCGLASYMMAANLVDGATGITTLGNTANDRAIDLAEKVQRMQTIIQNQSKIGGYSIYDLFRLAVGTPNTKGDFAWPYQFINYYDCNGNGSYDDYQGETCKAEMVNNIYNNQTAHTKILNSIISGHPVIAPIKSRVYSYSLGYPSHSNDYLLGINRGNHIVTIVGIDITHSGQIYYRYVDPIFNDPTVWFATKSTFLQSIRDNAGNNRYDMLLIKGH